MRLSVERTVKTMCILYMGMEEERDEKDFTEGEGNSLRKIKYVKSGVEKTINKLRKKKKSSSFTKIKFQRNLGRKK